jgi:hypothetical protein
MRKFLAMPWNRQNTLFSRETVPLKDTGNAIFFIFSVVFGELELDIYFTDSVSVFLPKKLIQMREKNQQYRYR